MKKQWGLLLAMLVATVVMVMGGCGGSSSGGGGNGSVGNTTSGSNSISGTVTTGGVGLGGVTITLSGGGSTTATTDSSGNYNISSVQNGSYTVTASLTGYTFSPVNQTVAVSGANVTGKDFTASATSANTYSISGTITSGGVALVGVTVSTSGGSATTDASGNYAICGLANGSFTVTPAKTGYTFSPATLAVTVNGANLIGKNFTATASSGATTGTVQLSKTGQTVSKAAGDDGALRKGVAWPNPRFTDNADGTVTDNLTGLIWLKNADCFSLQNWTVALSLANTLINGTCGLSDGSTVGQWRLPNINELESLLDISQFGPALPNGHPFSSVHGFYWSGSTSADGTNFAWFVGMDDGGVSFSDKGNGTNVWPVRAGQ